MREAMNWEAWQQHREEIVREVDLNRLARTLRAGRKTHGGRVFLLKWELRRMAGLLRKLARVRRTPRKGAKP